MFDFQIVLLFSMATDEVQIISGWVFDLPLPYSTTVHMKNMMIALCTMTITYAANAQYDPAFRFGIKAGANLSNINVATI